MSRTMRGRIMTAAAVATAAVALPLASAGTASADTNLRPHYTYSFLDCQTLGNQAAQAGQLSGFSCVQEGAWVVMYPW